MPTVKKSPSKPRRPSLKETNAKLNRENNELRRELQARNRDLTEALEQQTATSEILRVIASSPTELRPVFDTLIANAVRFSGATKGHVRQYDGEFMRVVAHCGDTPGQMRCTKGDLLQSSDIRGASHYREETYPRPCRSSGAQFSKVIRQTGKRTRLSVRYCEKEHQSARYMCVI